MKICSAVAFNQSLDMGLVLIKKSWDIVICPRAQYRRALRTNFAEQLIDAGVHPQIKINHAT